MVSSALTNYFDAICFFFDSRLMGVEHVLMEWVGHVKLKLISTPDFLTIE